VPTLPKVTWRRPNEISLRGELVGFDKLQAETGKQLSSLQGFDNTN